MQRFHLQSFFLFVVTLHSWKDPEIFLEFQSTSNKIPPKKCPTSLFTFFQLYFPEILQANHLIIEEFYYTESRLSAFYFINTAVVFSLPSLRCRWGVILYNTSDGNARTFFSSFSIMRLFKGCLGGQCELLMITVFSLNIRWQSWITSIKMKQ